jgi:hypothetical protein
MYKWLPVVVETNFERSHNDRKVAPHHVHAKQEHSNDGGPAISDVCKYKKIMMLEHFLPLRSLMQQNFTNLTTADPDPSIIKQK